MDKPLTATFEQARELGAIAKSKNLVLYPYQNRRWDSDFLALRALLDLPGSDPKSLGTLYEFESRYANISLVRLAVQAEIMCSAGSTGTVRH